MGTTVPNFVLVGRGKLRGSCFSFQSTGIIGVYHHHACFFFFFSLCCPNWPQTSYARSPSAPTSRVPRTAGTCHCYGYFHSIPKILASLLANALSLWPVITPRSRLGWVAIPPAPHGSDRTATGKTQGKKKPSLIRVARQTKVNIVSLLCFGTIVNKMSMPGTFQMRFADRGNFMICAPKFCTESPVTLWLTPLSIYH